MEQSESQIKKDILAYLKRVGIFAWNNPNITHGRKKNQVLIGVSDILGVLRDGRFLAIEVKKPKGKISDKQLEFLTSVKALGGKAIVARSVEEVQEKLKTQE